MPTFAHLPLGTRIPASVHAVSCSMPTIRDVCRYEEQDAETLRQITSAYPRFLVHPFARALRDHMQAARPDLAGRTLWLTTSASMADRLVAWLGTAGRPSRVEHSGVSGVAHDTTPDAVARAKSYLQHVGGYLSSREAEDHLVRLGLRDTVSTEDVEAGDAHTAIATHLLPRLTRASQDDLTLTNCGMNAVYTAFRAISDVQAARGRTVWIQVGWLYLDTIAILQKLTAAPGDHVFIKDVSDAAGIARRIAEAGPRLAGVITEVPTNPLVQTTDLPSLAAWCAQAGGRLIVDPSISSVYNLDVLPHADIVVCSLTKYTASHGDLTAGLVAVNPSGPDAATLRVTVRQHAEQLYPRDAARLAREIRDTASVLDVIHGNTRHVVEYLSAHPAVANVYWALHPASRDAYLGLARSPEAVGSLITFTLRQPGALARVYDTLRLPKGPSFGMTTTLLCPFMYLAHYDLVSTESGRARLRADGLDPDLLRLSVGVEPLTDIITVLAEALAAA